MARTVAGSWVAARKSAWLSAPIRSGSPPYQASGVGQDRALRLVGAGEEEPVPPGRGEPRVRTRQSRADRHAVEHGEAAHRLWRVQREAHGDIAAAVVADDGEPLVPEPAHQRQHVTGHGPLGVRAVVGRRFRLGGRP